MPGGIETDRSAPPQMPMSTSSPLLNRKTEGQLSAIEKAQTDTKKAEEEQNKAPVQALAAQISTRWQAALMAKSTQIEAKLLGSLRKRRGEYSPEKLASIREFGGSEVFMMLTNVKCRAAEAWLRDVLLPPGDKPWSLSPTPEPKLPQGKEAEITKQVHDETVILMMQGGIESVSTDQITKRTQEIKNKVAAETLAYAKESTLGFETRINDELTEGNYYESISCFIKDLTTFPTAFLKGPEVRRRKKLVWTEDQDGNVVPAVDLMPSREYYAPSPFDIYPSPGSRGIQDGYLCERKRYRRSDLVSMIGVPGYNERAVRAALLEYGTGGNRQWLTIDQERADIEDRPNEFDDPDPLIDCVEYWGSAQGKTLLEWGMDKKQIPDVAIDYQITGLLIGRWLVMARLNPHPLGKRPYMAASFDSVNNNIWGKCPADLMDDVQDICNATARAMVNNLAIASGPQVEVYTDRVQPGEDVENQYPWKIWKTKSDGNPGNNPAVRWFQPDPLTDVLMSVYEYFFKQASEQTGIPAYTYGSADVGGAGKTASGLSMLMNAASKTMKSVIAHIDERVIKPSIKDHWLHIMLFDDDIEKAGDINVVARASEHLIMAEQLQMRRSEFMAATNNDWDQGIIGDLGRAEMLRNTADSLKLNTDKIIPTEDELKTRMAPAAGPMVGPDGMPLPDPAVIDAAGGAQGASPAASMAQGISASRG